MYQKLQGEPFTIFGDGSQKRAFTFIDDCLLPFWKAATLDACSKQIINLGGTTYTSILEAATLLTEIIGGASIQHLEQRHEVKDALPGHEKSIRLLDYSDKTPLKEGLKIMWNWAKAQPVRERMQWEKYELEKGLYGFWK